MESCPIQNSIDGRAILKALMHSVMSFFLILQIAFAVCLWLGEAIVKIIAAMPRAIIRSSRQEVRAFKITCQRAMGIHMQFSSLMITPIKSVEAI